MSTQYYGKAATAASRILTAFESSTVPKALAPIFIHRRDNVPCRRWSWSNQLITALHGHADARGFRQWEKADRRVKKGERAFYILAPCTRKLTQRDSETGEEVERVIVYGFRGVPVFGLQQTDGKALPVDTENQRFLDGLPVISVALAWGLTVETFDGADARHRGSYRPGEGIALGVKNPATWAHELVHAADDRNLGGLKRGQHLDQETVASLGGATLLACLGHDADADTGGAWEYINYYAKKNGKAPIAVCERLLSRACEAVALILDAAENLVGAESGVAA